MGSQRVRHDWVTNTHVRAHTHTHTHTHTGNETEVPARSRVIWAGHDFSYLCLRVSSVIMRMVLVPASYYEDSVKIKGVNLVKMPRTLLSMKHKLCEYYRLCFLGPGRYLRRATVLVCPGLTGCLGHGTFSCKTRTIWGKPRGADHSGGNKWGGLGGRRQTGELAPRPPHPARQLPLSYHGVRTYFSRKAR